MHDRFWLSLLGLSAFLSGCDLATIRQIDRFDGLLGDQVGEARAALGRRAPAADGSFRFVLIGDSRGGLDILGRQMAEVDALDPAFVLYTGDLVSKGSEQEYRDGFAVLRSVRAPVFPSIGNHERENGGVKWYYQFFGKDLDYAFDFGDWRFISIDNSLGTLNSGQLAWLQIQLQTSRRKVVIAHMPPPIGIWRVHPFTGNYKAFMATVEAAKVDACLFGHIHIYDKAEKRGVRYVVSGGGGAPLYRLPIFNSREGGAFHHYVVAQAGPAGVSFELRKSRGLTPVFEADVPDDEPAGDEGFTDF